MTRYSPRTGLPTTYQTGPFDAPHLYVQWGGKLAGGEKWSNGVRMAYTGFEMPATIPAGLMTAASSAIQALHVHTSIQTSNTCKLSFIKFARIGVDGHYVPNVPGGQVNPQEIVVADLAGANASPQQPNQIALAVTLATGYTRGPAHKGRFYLPVPNMFPATDGLLAASQANGVQDAASIWLTNLNAADPDYRVAVFSRKAGAPIHRLVTGIHVGRVLDTQRRRRRSLTELYVTV